MVEKPLSAGQPSEKGTPNFSGIHPATASAPTVPLFHFRLRQLMWFIAVLSALLAGIVSASGVTALVLLMAALVVGAHLFSTALGSRLRADADRSAVGNAEHLPPPSGSGDCLAARSSTRRSPWHGRGSTTLPWLRALIITGVLIGASGGAVLIMLTMGHRTSVPGIIIGSASAAVLGGWFAFLGGSFYGIFRHGLRDALAEQRKDESPQQVRQ